MSRVTIFSELRLAPKENKSEDSGSEGEKRSLSDSYTQEE